MTDQILKNKKIVLGITGSIAAFKSASIITMLKKRDANIRVVMTKNARKFITSLSLQTLSQNRVYTDMFSLDWEMRHISLGQCDILVIAPATANIIGKIANGICDDLLSTTVLTTEAPVLICPAMNNKMYQKPQVQKNIKTLKDFNYLFIEPRTGRLACNIFSKGRLPEPEEIVKEIKKILLKRDKRSKIS